MSSPMVRGYCVLRALSFLDEHLGSQAGRAVKESLSRDFHAAAANLSPSEWCPRELHVELMRAMARARGDEALAREDLVRCGESMAVEAHDTFLRFAIGIMTPHLFSKKLPGMFDINHRSSGHFEVETSDASHGRMRAKLVGVGGYDHIALAYEGWIRRGLARVGKPEATVHLEGYSAHHPGPDMVTYEIGWS